MRSILSLATLLALTTAASAAVIPFDPDGAGPSPVVGAGSFDFLPGNILLSSGQPGAAAPVTTIYYQARLGALLDGAGKVIPTPGLNAASTAPAAYEITAVFAINVTSTPAGGAAVISSVPAPTTAYYSIYYDRAVNASDLTGTGFRDGTRIYSGTVNFAFGSLAANPALTLPLDFFSGNYAGISSILSSGGLKVIAATNSTDPAFFTGGSPASLLTDTTLATPYFHIDPSANFDIGPDGFTTPHAPAIGLVNGTNAESVLESDGSTSFLPDGTNIPFPEPTSLALLLPATSLLARRRRNQA